MLVLKIIYRFIRHYWLYLLLALAVIIALKGGLLSWLGGKDLTVLQTPVKIEKTIAIGQLITAQYYGESLASLRDVYKGQNEDEISHHYAQLREALTSKKAHAKSLKKDKQYVFFKYVSKAKNARQLANIIKHSSWKTFYKEHQQIIHEHMHYYALDESNKADLVYLGRGIVQAGFDLRLLSPDHIDQQGDTIYLRNFDPILFQPEINPLMVPEKNIPGFQVVSQHKKNRISLDQVMLVKKACIAQLQQRAIDKGILKKAIRNAEHELSAFFSQIEKTKKHVRIVPTPLHQLHTAITTDSVVDKKEAQKLAQHIIDHPQDSNHIRRLIKGIHVSTVSQHPAFAEVHHKVVTLNQKTPTLHHVAHATTSVRQQHENEIKALGDKSESDWDKHWKIKAAPPSKKVKKKRHKAAKTFGWHPSWMGSSYKHYRFDLLWGVSYFGCKLDPATGDLLDTDKWKKTPMPGYAKAGGSKVFLTISNFGFSRNKRFLTNGAAQARLLDSIPPLLAAQEADGINVDFEQVPHSMKAEFTAFLLKLAAKLKENGYSLTLCLYAVDFGHVFDIPALKDEVELFTMMGYDYYYGGSKIAGPVSPLTKGHKLAPHYNLENSVKSYLKNGLPPGKFVVALPYYGSEWKTTGKAIPSATAGHVRSPAYRQIVKDPATKKDKWHPDLDAKVRQGTHKGHHTQLWYDDAQSLSKKYKWLKKQGIAGVGIWALGYDNGHNELWDLLQKEFGEAHQ